MPPALREVHDPAQLVEGWGPAALGLEGAVTPEQLEVLARSAVDLGVQHALSGTFPGVPLEQLVTRAAQVAVDALVAALRVHVVGDVLMVRDERAACALSLK